MLVDREIELLVALAAAKQQMAAVARMLVHLKADLAMPEAVRVGIDEAIAACAPQRLPDLRSANANLRKNI